MKNLNLEESLICKSFEGLTFTASVCETASGLIKTKMEKEPVKLDYFIAVLIKKGIPYSISEGRLQMELRYEIAGVKVKSLIN